MWMCKKMAEMAKHRGPVKATILAGMASTAPPLGKRKCAHLLSK